MFAGTKFREIEIDDPMSFLFLFLQNNINQQFQQKQYAVLTR